VRPRDYKLAERLEGCLLAFDREKHPLPAIRDSAIREVFLEQLLESIHRVNYVSVIRNRNLSERRADPNDQMFDPLKAAILHQRQGYINEAFWLVFLFVHFGKHARAGWRYTREIYGRLGDEARWDWASIRADPSGFREWLDSHQAELKREGVPHGFGNHRKYESLAAYSPNGTGAVVESYVRWVGPPRGHRELIDQACQQASGDPRKAFDILYQSMRAVRRFGRTARFDYLAMVGKLALAPIEPGSAYLKDSTGPIAGARLLFGGQTTTALSGTDLDSWVVELDAELKVGMQVLEDALCNWQKSPGRFKPFRG
jgi:hypothetical protein